MQVTEVKVFPVNEEKLKAYATITFDDSFIVRDVKVIHGNSGLFVAMPSKKRKDGSFKDVAHPLNNETRRMIESKVLEEYESELANLAVKEEAPSLEAPPAPELSPAPEVSPVPETPVVPEASPLPETSTVPEESPLPETSALPEESPPPEEPVPAVEEPETPEPEKKDQGGPPDYEGF